MTYTPQSITTAPRDGTLFYMIKNGVLYTDCRFDDMGYIVRDHGYPSITRRWLNTDGATWLPRPEGLLRPYEINSAGNQFIPGNMRLQSGD